MPGTLWRRRFGGVAPGSGGGVAAVFILTVAVGTWSIDDGVGPANGAFVSADGISFNINDALTSGLTIVKLGSHYSIQYP